MIKNRWLPVGRESNAMTVWPLLFVRSDRTKYFTKRVECHEQIHARQQRELTAVGTVLACLLLTARLTWEPLLVIGLFYWLYGLFYVIGWMRFRNHDDAYSSIPFEQEAYACQDSPDYLERRKAFAWFFWII